MGIIVQKYGGSSVVNEHRIHQAAERILQTRRGGHDEIVVAAGDPALGAETS